MTSLPIINRDLTDHDVFKAPSMSYAIDHDCHFRVALIWWRFCFYLKFMKTVP